MGISEAIARVKKGVRAGGFPAVMAELGEQLRSEVIPAPLRPAAVRLASLLGTEAASQHESDAPHVEGLPAADEPVSPEPVLATERGHEPTVAQAVGDDGASVASGSVEEASVEEVGVEDVSVEDVSAEDVSAEDVSADVVAVVEQAASPADAGELHEATADAPAAKPKRAKTPARAQTASKARPTQPVETAKPAASRAAKAKSGSSAAPKRAAKPAALPAAKSAPGKAPAHKAAPSKTARSKAAPAAKKAVVPHKPSAPQKPVPAAKREKEKGKGDQKLAARSPSANTLARPNAKPLSKRPSSKVVSSKRK
jgi:hypothetical protein